MSCIAGALALIGAVMVARASAARLWPTAPGIVLGTRVDSKRGSDQTVSHYPAVEYQYEVGGQTYRADRLFIGDRNLNLGYHAAAKQVARYTPGSPVAVRYNPRNPAEALLEISTPGAWWLFGTAALIFLTGLGLAVLFMAVGI